MRRPNASKHQKISSINGEYDYDLLESSSGYFSEDDNKENYFTPTSDLPKLHNADGTLLSATPLSSIGLPKTSVGQR